MFIQEVVDTMKITAAGPTSVRCLDTTLLKTIGRRLEIWRHQDTDTVHLQSIGMSLHHSVPQLVIQQIEQPQQQLELQ